MFPAEVAQGFAPSEARRDLGPVYIGVAAQGNPGRAAAALVTGRGTRARVFEGEITVPVAYGRALLWALDLLDPGGYRADLWTNCEVAETTDKRLLSHQRDEEQGFRQEPGSFGALRAEAFRRCLATGSRIRFVRTAEAPAELLEAINAANRRLRGSA